MKQDTLLSACMRAGFCLVLLLSAHASHGQTVKTVELNYSEKDFEFIQNKDGSFVVSSVNDVYAYGTDSSTAVPIVGILVLIESDQEFVSVSYSSEKNLLRSNITLAPCSDLLPNTNCEKVSETRQRQLKRMPSLVEYTGTHIIDGCKLLSFSICPFDYDGRKETLLLQKRLSLNITLKDVSQNKRKPNLRVPSNETWEIVQSLVVNPEDLERYYEPSLQLQYLSASNSTSNRADYLIITSNSFSSYFSPLLKWKTQKGVPAKLYTIESILSQNTENISNQLKIKKFIKDCYDNRGTRYVLLGGDTNIIPAQQCYANAVGTDEDFTIPADMFYACMDNDLSWDSNNNGILGEEGDNVDYAPDVSLTRIPVRSATDVETFVNRQLEYEKAPPTSNWKHRLLMGGCHEYMDTIVNGVLMSDAQYMCDKIYKKYIYNYWDGQLYRFFDTATDFSGGANFDFNSFNLMSVLSSGYPFIFIKTHGVSAGWNGEGEGFSTWNASSLNNSTPTVIVTSSCETNAFDVETCLSEAFMRNTNSNVIGYVGSSRVGISNPYIILGNDEFLGNYLKQMLSYSQSFGDVLRKIKCYNLSFFENVFTSFYRYVSYALNALGDPEMKVYNSCPLEMVMKKIDYSDGTLTINNENGDCYNVCIMSLSDDGESYYNYLTHYSGLLTLENIPDNVSICLTYEGYIPYVCIIENGKLYIQNDELGNDYDWSANEIVIGSDVTTNKDTGNVVVSGQNVKIRGASGIEIRNNFEVRQGATLLIGN